MLRSNISFISFQFNLLASSIRETSERHVLSVCQSGGLVASCSSCCYLYNLCNARECRNENEESISLSVQLTAR
jgi:hypothetical protein